MKRNILLTLATLCIIVSCGARKVQKVDKFEKQTEKTDSTFQHVKSVETLKDVFTTINTNTFNDVISWSYEAPNEDIKNVSPVWIRTGKDSINLSSLPKGSKLHFTNDKTKTNETKDETAKTKTNEKDETKTNVKKTKTNENRERTKDIKREATNWILAFVAFLVGWFAIPTIKLIIKKLSIWQK